MPYALCLMPYALCLMPYALRLTPHASCLMAHGSWLMAHASCLMPASLETALEEAGKLESTKAAKKRLQRVKMSTGALPVVAAVRESETPHKPML